MFKILIVEDSPDDLFFFKKALSKTELKIDIHTASDGISGLNLLSQEEYDCIFLDYHLPGMNGLDFLMEARSFNMNTPIIMLTGQRDEQTTVKLMKAGANDYIPKNSLTPDTLRISIENARRLYEMRNEKIKAIDLLRISKERLSEAQEIANLGNWEYNSETEELYFSDSAHKILGFRADTTLSFFQFIKKVHPNDRAVIKKCIASINKGSSYDITFRIINDNVLKFIQAKGHFIINKNGKIGNIVGTVQDITLLKNALNDIRKAKIGRRATSIVFGVAIGIFIISEAIFDPFIDALQFSLIIALSFKGGLALFLKPIEVYVEKFMLSKVSKT